MIMRMSVEDNWSEGCNSSENQSLYSEHLFAWALFGCLSFHHFQVSFKSRGRS